MSGQQYVPEERLVVVADTFTNLIANARFFLEPKPVPVLTELKGDVSATVAQTLSKLGLCVAVIMPDGYRLTRRGESLGLMVRLVAEISELVLINQGAGVAYRSALAAATAAMKAVHLQPNGLDAAGAMHRAGINEFTLPEDQPFRLIPDRKFVTYHVTAFTTVEI